MDIDAFKKSMSTKYFFLFLILAVLLTITGYYYYEKRKELIKAEKYNELTAITELKIDQISKWREERINDGKAILYNALVIDGITKFVSNPADLTQRNKIESWFSSLKKLYDYKNVFLIDSEGQTLIKTNKSVDDKYTNHHLLFHPQKGEVIFSNLHKNNEENIFIDLIIPCFNDDTYIGSIIAQIDPNEFLFPLIQTWPTPSKTSESLIIRRDGDNILFLNELRHRKNTALTLKITITQEDLPAAKAALGIEGMVEGKDYRKVDVLASVNKIPSSRWFMVTKVDANEIFAPIQILANQLIFVLILVIITVAGIITSIWRHQRSLQYKKQYKLEAEKNALTKRYEYLTKHANDIILLTDSHGKIIEANERALSFYGYTIDELKKVSLSEIRLSSNKSSLRKTLEAINAADGKTYEAIHINKDGEEIPVEISARLITIDNKNFFQAIIRDISERKEADRKLKHLNTLYATLSQVNQTILHSARIQDLFDQLCKVMIEYGNFQFSLIGLVNSKNKQIELASFSGLANGFGKWLINETNVQTEGFNPIKKAITNNKLTTVNNYDTFKGNDKLKFEITKRNFKSSIAVPLHLNKRVVGVLSIFSKDNILFDRSEIELIKEIASDISYALEKFESEKKHRDAEKKIRENERQLSTLLGNLPGIAYRCKNDRDWTMQFISAGCYELTGYQADEIVNNEVISYKNLIYTDDRERVVEQITPSLNNKEGFTLEYRIKTKDGRLKWVWEKGIGIYDKDNNIEALEGFISDITQRKAIEEELIVSKEKAESANKLKSEFLAQMSHEIRTPINVITNFCGFLKDKYETESDEDTLESFNIINSAGQRIIRTIDLILNMAELQTGSYEPILKKINLNDILKKLITEFKPLAESKGLSISLINTEDASSIISADEYSITQVFSNLIDNAIKYTHYGSIRIIISDDNDNTVKVTVADTGIGIAENYLPTLFNPFSQEERGYTRKFDGNGLGLALVKNYCNINNALIFVESEKGKGSEFTVELNSFLQN